MRAATNAAGPRADASVSDHILDLAALALGARGDYAEMARQRSAKAARFAAIKSDILHALGRSDLSTEMIARAARHFAALCPKAVRAERLIVLRLRAHRALAKAQRMLIDRRYGHLNIAQIAT